MRETYVARSRPRTFAAANEGHVAKEEVFDRGSKSVYFKNNIGERYWTDYPGTARRESYVSLIVCCSVQYHLAQNTAITS
jgi:hypothetical protein